MKAIRIHQYGPPDVLTREELDMPSPRPGEVLVKVDAAGVNFADVARRRNTYLDPTPLPCVLGVEIAGSIVELGEGVTSFMEGDYVAGFTRGGSGGYAEYALAPEHALFRVPPGLNTITAAALPVQGLSAWHVLRTCGQLKPGETVLVHAAAGGVGTFAVQLAKAFGARRVIGTASTADKLQIVRALGADAAIDYTDADWPEQVRAANEGRGVDIVLEMVGGQVFTDSLKVLGTFGRLVVYGAVSGEHGSVRGRDLMRRCQSVIGFYLVPALARSELSRFALADLTDQVTAGRVHVRVDHMIPLAEAARAHRLLESRQTTGKIVLMP